MAAAVDGNTSATEEPASQPAEFPDARDDSDLGDPQDPDDSDYYDSTHVFHYQGLYSLIESHNRPYVSDTRDAAPYNDIPTRSQHNAMQRAAWRELENQALVDPSIPEALFNPPRTSVRVLVAAWPRRQHFCCACDLPEDLPTVVVRAPAGSETGVTKGLLLQKLGEALYGRDAATAQLGGEQENTDDGHVIGQETDRPVVQHFTHMERDSYLLGHIFALTKGIQELDDME
ncbi:hypothetical protein TruAng_006201 [Truncatella angustata]|nr:hypothetical protein TruAng_006201 [Truncatella angustata]